MPADDRPHIGFAREPEIEADRRRRRPHGQSYARTDRNEHGQAIEEQTSTSLDTITSERQQLGVAADRLLVIQFSSWDRNVRDVFEERFGVVVVDEQLDVVNEQDRTRVLVQFPSLDKLREFADEIDRYASGGPGGLLPFALRRNFYDAMESVGLVTSDQRKGPRLRKEGWPQGATEVAFDVDLWHPGTPETARAALDQLRSICQQHGARVVDDTRTESLVLARVKGSPALGDLLLKHDIVARVDLPPRLGDEYTNLFDPVTAAPIAARPSAETPVACVIDSGMLAAHPLLQGWVLDERDFGTDEGVVADVQGHGTRVGGLVVYGDVARCLADQSWSPRVAVVSAKVLQRDDVPPHGPRFPDGKRPESMVEAAIRHFHAERGCRVFNLSAANADEVYTGGRQYPWAEKLDQLARELDVVIVVAAGNRPPATIPQAATRQQFQEAVRDLLLTDADQRVCNPATAALAVTVGAIARSETPRQPTGLPGAPLGSPTPFTRTGFGYEVKPSQRGTKPEVVEHGGNLMVHAIAGGNARWREDVFLGEPTTQIPDGGRLVGTASGTSFAAPHVASAAAQSISPLSAALGSSPSANAIRAVIGVTTNLPTCGPGWLLDPDANESDEKLRLVGYGVPQLDRILTSSLNDVVLVAEDSCGLDKWQLYSLPIPASFLAGRGARGLVVSLAYDPPVRSSRRGYLARTMWIEVLKGLSVADVQRFRTRHTGQGQAPSIPGSNVLAMRPPKEPLQWSTLQVRRAEWSRSPRFPADANGDVNAHILVGCQSRFPAGAEIAQRYAIAVRLWHSGATVDLHQDVRSRVRGRVALRVRGTRG